MPQNYRDFPLQFHCEPCCWLSSTKGKSTALSRVYCADDMRLYIVYSQMLVAPSALCLLSLWPRITCLVQTCLGSPLPSYFIPIPSVNVISFTATRMSSAPSVSHCSYRTVLILHSTQCHLETAVDICCFSDFLTLTVMAWFLSNPRNVYIYLKVCTVCLSYTRNPTRYWGHQNM